MKYIVMRDDDTNALMPVSCLERLYRPFLDRGLPVNLAVIPKVSAEASYVPGQPEKFLMTPNPSSAKYVPIGKNKELVDYLLANPLYHVVQHGCCHESVHGRREFDHDDQADIVHRLEEGAHLLRQAGFGHPTTFVAPYDQLSTVSLREVACRFRVLSTGWYEWDRLPLSWRPKYLVKKLTGTPHWRVGPMVLLSHPGCKLSYQHSYDQMMEEIEKSIQSSNLTVLVTHWWEYFRDGREDAPFINILHQTAKYLAERPDVQVVSFSDIAEQKIALN
ncbi:MAG TPA: DUF2334 domain-containing protein [Candidatus Saccharimonadales bacterium]|nr:DUF2334 domain-containing protein [Candidatus Saccharimonadales bacterium]